MMADDSLYPPDLMAELSPSQDAFVRRCWPVERLAQLEPRDRRLMVGLTVMRIKGGLGGPKPYTSLAAARRSARPCCPAGCFAASGCGSPRQAARRWGR